MIHQRNIKWIILVVVFWVNSECLNGCGSDLFECHTGHTCIARSWKCDGEKDCPDGEDEFNCPKQTCGAGKFLCNDGKLCIPAGWKCDTEEDCIDGSDELEKECEEEVFHCPPNQHLCYGTKFCIGFGHLCDGIVNCRDQSDEGHYCSIENYVERCKHNVCPDPFNRAKCVINETSHICYCDEGFHYIHTDTYQGCIDLNECDYDGYCDQLCTNHDRGYTCNCVQGYQLNDQKTCIAINDPENAPAKLLLIDEDHLKIFNIDKSSQMKLQSVYSTSINKKAGALDYSYDNSSFCYVSLDPVGSSYVFNCSSFQNAGDFWQLPITYSLKSIKEVSYDWVAKNWYFTDEEHEMIFMCNYLGTLCNTVIYTNLRSPQSIVVDPLSGFIFYSLRGESPGIERALLDGSQREKLVQNNKIVRPTGLTLDFVKKHLYWSDSYLDRIERIDYSGQKITRRVIMANTWVENMFSLGLHEMFIYATSQGHNSLNVVRFGRNGDDKDKGQIVLNMTITPWWMRIIHRQRQPYVTSVCDTAHCSHLCVALPNGSTNYIAKCLCKAGYEPHPQNSTRCIRVHDEPRFLLFANAKLGEIKGVSLSNPNLEVMEPIRNLQRPVALDYHLETQFVYYSDPVMGTIGRRKVDGSQRNDSFISKGVSNCEGIAIDWLGLNIYWTDESLKTITVASLGSPEFYKVLIDKGLSHPRAIVLNPNQTRGLMIWTDWVQKPSSSGAKIWIANMDGTKARVLVNSSILWPNGLSLDIISERLYWIDAYTDKIESINVNPNSADLDRKTITQGKYNGFKHPYGMAHIKLTENVFYWTEFTEGVIKKWTSNGNTTIIRNESAPLYELRIFDNDTDAQIGDNGCSSMNCKYLCLARSNGSVCACPEDMEFAQDKHTCQLQSNISSSVSCNNETEFTCDNGRCINLSWKCDGDNDCGDKSDENATGSANCDHYECPDKDNMFKCQNNKCIYNRWLCDGEADCPNGEDEEVHRCKNRKCSESSMIRCPISHRCIHSSWKCDHDNDCGEKDGFDEKNCTYEACTPDQFICDNKRCISRQYRCDGDNDCRDNSDEVNCAENKCNNATHFQCAISQVCIEQLFLCDGEFNCKANNTVNDTSDEENCRRIICSEDSFRCSNTLCIDRRLECDGDDDCGDNSDELHCNGTDEASCNAEGFLCKGERRCIPQKWRCDGDKDCQSGLDEENCTQTVPVVCDYPNRHCHNDPTVCITPNQLCNNIRDCKDGSDESSSCNVSCIRHSCSYKCLPSPEGQLCTCPQGKQLGSDNKTCEDAHPCDRWGTCSQNCTKISHSRHAYKCECHQGYQLNTNDYHSCDPIDEMKPFLIFSNRHEIRRLDLNMHNYSSMVSGLRNTIALDYYYSPNPTPDDQSLVFWTDVVDDKIYKGTLISGGKSITDIKEVVNVGIAVAEGIAIDWVTKHLYWVESILDQIEVSDFNGTERLTLISENIESPRAIALDPSKGLIFWSDWDHKHPRIERCSMSGDNRKHIFNIGDITGGGWPNGLTVDYETNRVYWIDARSDSAHSVTYDGQDHRTIVHGRQFLSHPFAITVFGNYIYWSDWRTNAIVRANKFNGSDIQVIQRTVTQPFDVHIFHPKRQPAMANPCAVNNNGGCGNTSICLLTDSAGSNRTACRCPHLKKLKPDGKTCMFDGSFLLFAKKEEIRGIDLSATSSGVPPRNVIPAVTVPHVLSPVSIDYCKEGEDYNMYWIDTNQRYNMVGIHKAKLDGTGFQTVIDKDLHNPTGLAIDWISGNLYFSSYSDDRGQIEVSTLNGTFRTVLLHGADKGLTKPTSLAVDPMQGKLYWTDNGTMSQPGGVWMANMDGTDVYQLFGMQSGSKLYANKPTGITIDFDNKRLYWINKNVSDMTPSLVHSSLSGENPTSVHFAEKYGTPLAIALYGNELLVSNSESILKVVNGSNPSGKAENFRTQTKMVMAMKVFLTDRYSNATSSCVNQEVPCSHLCLPNGQGNRTCKCTVGFQTTDGTNCTGIDTFLMYSDTTEVLGLVLTNTSVHALAPISNIVSATAIDYYAAEDYIYWVDADARAISRIKRDLTKRQVLFHSGIMGVEGIAIDWMAGNMYWVDDGYDTIEVARLNGSNRYIVVQDNLDKPRNIIVDPENGHLYWTDWGMEPKIERSLLNGSQREILIGVNISHPAGLALDVVSNTEKILYWCDQHLKTIEKVDLSRNRPVRKVIVKDVTKCMGLTVYNDSIYWTASTNQKGAIFKANKVDGSNKIMIKSNIENPVQDIKVYSKHKQTGTNTCSNENNGCEGLCFYMGNNNIAECACAHGKVFEGKKCAEHETFLAYSKVKGIDTHTFDGSSSTPPRPAIEEGDKMMNVIGLAFDYNNKRYFFSDIQQGNIQAVPFSKPYNFEVIVDAVGSAEGLAFDPTSQNLYWTSYSYSTINRISLHPDKQPSMKEIKVQLGTEDHPRAIVLNSCQSKMYWTNWNDKYASIQSAHMSGWGVKSIITTEIETPNGLTIDYAAGKLYWADARLDKIERCDYNGTNRVVIAPSIIQHGFGLTVYGDWLFWTDWVLRAVIRVNKYTGEDVTYIMKNIPRQPMGIVAVTNDTAACFSNLCEYNNGGCSQGCRTDERATRVCYCNQNFTLQNDSVTCLAQSQCGEGEFPCSDKGCIDLELTCNNISNCIDGSDEKESYCSLRSCPAGYFHCSNGMCITDNKYCNGINNCYDNSDEDNCKCDNNEFQCNDGACILARYHCDYDRDCLDASDEQHCGPANCSAFGPQPDGSPLVACNRTTSCILDIWFCDGHDDCWDGEDEENCPNATSEPNVCDEHWRKCNGSNHCIPYIWTCDGDFDCPDHSDEQNCQYTCPSGQKFCDDQIHCIPIDWMCDGYVECEDKSDESEKNCKEHRGCLESEFACNGDKSGCVPYPWVCDGEKDCDNGEDELPAAGCVPMPCDEGEFQCQNYNCIKSSFYCDRDDDCGDGSDEPDTCVYETCNNETEFQCKIIHQCVPINKQCDNNLDCWDHTDESPSLCQKPCGNKDMFKCSNGLCINSSKVCDRFNNCGDSSDELLCGIDECSTGTRLCAQGCRDLKIGYECQCETGYELNQTDKRSCKDVDECNTIYPCTHYCRNTPGSFKCSCAYGFKLGTDKKSCKVYNETVPFKPVLLVSNRYYIRNISLTGNHTELLAMNLSNAVALDFYWPYNRTSPQIYWSDVTSEGSSISVMDANGTHRRVLHNTTVRNPDGLAIDWLGKNIYWCDKTTDTIEVSNLDGYYRKVLVRDGLQEPRALVVNPFRGYIFYTDWGDKPHIGTLGMDGSLRLHRNRYLITENLGWPNALTIDYYAEKIFWADARLDYIAFADFNGQNRKYVVQEGLSHVFAITVFEDTLYWTDWEYKSIERAHKFSGKDKRNVTFTIHRPMDIQVLHPFRQQPQIKSIQRNPCTYAPCGEGTLCLIKPGGIGYLCACPERHYQSINKKTCIANCTSSEFLCPNTYKCIPFWWRCDRQNDCGDNADEPSDCPEYHCKQPGLYQCVNTTQCISPAQICDGVKQCPDGTDEFNCSLHTCLETQFKCDSKPKCIDKSRQCNGVNDCDDRSDEKRCPTNACADNQFTCDNKRCIPYVWRCDNDDDCGDGSDENNCQDTQSCDKAGYLACNHSGRCIPRSWFCDGDQDCPDGSDEDDNCKDVTCDPTYFQCKDHRCIPGRWLCDNDEDCPDASDESNCTRRQCSEIEFRCNTNICIKNTSRCDGHHHCSDGSDEANCTTTSQMCRHNEFKCKDTGHCIPEKWKCDREPDCLDHSDERNCVHYKWNCSSGQFTCSDGQCIPGYWRCDGMKDCLMGEDEDKQTCEQYSCMPGYYTCTNESVIRCIPYRELCDGVTQCPSGEDELNCPQHKCKADEFECVNSKQCIPLHHVCDNYTDCVDNSDEDDSICKLTTKPCQAKNDCLHKQVCVSSKCVCHSPYYRTIQGENGTAVCEDVNECEEFGICSQVCNNREGRQATCTCMTNYSLYLLLSLKIGIIQQCFVKGKAPVALVALDNDILRVHLDSTNSTHNKMEKPINSTGLQLKINSMDMYNVQGEKTIFLTAHYNRSGKILSYYLPDSNDKSPRQQRDLANHLPEQFTEVKVDGGILDPAGLAVDWLNGKLFWADKKAGTISMCDFSGQNRVDIIRDNLHGVDQLVIDPKSGLLFWTQTGLNPKIESSLLTGENRSVLVSSVIWPAGLAIDYPNRRLYWTDAKLRTVESTWLDGSDRKRSYIFKEDSPQHLDVFEEYLYVVFKKPNGQQEMKSLFKFGPEAGKPAIPFPILQNPIGRQKRSRFNNFRKHIAPMFKGDLSAKKSNKTLVKGLSKMSDILIVQEYKQETFIDSCKKISPPCGPNFVCLNVGGQHSCICPSTGLLSTTNNTCPESSLVHNSCTDSYCKNNGTCHERADGSLKCACTDRYLGMTCEKDVCYDRCLAGGICKAFNGKATCYCLHGYSGSRCEHYNCDGYCARGMCYLVPGNETANCVCPAGYGGLKCEKKVHPCENFCKNGGSCKHDLRKGRPVCTCKDGYTGTKCDICSYNCTGDQCNQYQCYEVNSYCIYNGHHDPSCQCAAGFTNQRICNDEHSATMACHEHCVNPCAKKNCNENMHCVLVGKYNTTTDCECNKGWSGHNCDIHITDCLINACQNGGSCLTGGEHHCKCSMGYSGPMCETRDGCKEQCKNGGKCLEDGDVYRCQCNKQWTGQFCERHIAETCQQYCLNDGHCIDCTTEGVSSPTCTKCECVGDWTGDTCNSLHVHSSSSSLNITVIVVPIIICILIIAILVAVVIYRRQHFLNQFRHKPMTNPAPKNEFRNPIYAHEAIDDEELQDIIPFKSDSTTSMDTIFTERNPTNFANPMYEEFYSEDAAGTSTDTEKKRLLKNKSNKLEFYEEDF